MITLRKINNEIVKPLNIPRIDKEKIKGCNLFDIIYSNIFILAKKNSGKTTAIYKILKDCINKNSIIYIFCSTVHKDVSYDKIMEMLDKKKVKHFEFTSIIEDKINHLEQIMNNLQQQPEEEQTKINYIRCDESEEEYEYKPKKIAPEHIFLFDDLSNQISNKFVNVLLKKNRHFKSKTIISSQYLHDLKPEAIINLDYMLMFGNIPLEKLKIVYNHLDLSIPFELFIKMYENSTKEKYNFFYVNIRDEQFRKNFNFQYQIN
jgi:hypothetical protein